ncbi:hypothetical protein BMR85_013840 [Achromobacter sp. KAs 3-5]|nr:hypothetical protein BMR85_013840 [Achromobacter sp. KAs 3-5]
MFVKRAHYSYEHYKKLGIEDDQLLAEETAEAMAEKAVLRALWLFDEDGDCRAGGHGPGRWRWPPPPAGPTSIPPTAFPSWWRCWS